MQRLKKSKTTAPQESWQAKGGNAPKPAGIHTNTCEKMPGAPKVILDKHKLHYTNKVSQANRATRKYIMYQPQQEEPLSKLRAGNKLENVATASQADIE